jgi:hypothetical protein
MKEDERSNIEMSLRKNHGRRLIADWSRSLSAASGIEIRSDSLLSIEQTQVLKRAFFIKVKSESQRRRLTWERPAWEHLLAHLLDVCINVRTMPIVLFSSIDQFIGAIRLPADCVLRNVLAIWEVVGEDLSLTTDDLQHGLCLEENFYTPSGDYMKEGVYELIAWGRFERVM